MALASRQLVRVRPRSVGEADQGQALVDPPGPGVAETDVAGHREVREERAVLEDHADAAALGLFPDAVTRDRPAADGDGAGVGDLETGDDAQQGRLARAARSEERHQLALLDGDRRTRDRARPAERLADVDSVDRAADSSR